MKPTKGELIIAAEVLRKNCEYSNMCQDCPFEIDMKYCALDGFPVDWKLEDNR